MALEWVFWAYPILGDSIMVEALWRVGIAWRDGELSMKHLPTLACFYYVFDAESYCAAKDDLKLAVLPRPVWNWWSHCIVSTVLKTFITKTSFVVLVYNNHLSTTQFLVLFFLFSFSQFYLCLFPLSSLLRAYWPETFSKDLIKGQKEPSSVSLLRSGLGKARLRLRSGTWRS